MSVHGGSQGTGAVGIKIADGVTRLNETIRKLNQGKLKEGQKILEELRSEEPDDPTVLYNLGMCYSEQGNLEAPIEVLERCIALAPDFVNAYAALGFSYARNEQTAAFDVAERLRTCKASKSQAEKRWTTAVAPAWRTRRRQSAAWSEECSMRMASWLRSPTKPGGISAGPRVAN